ncbi:MAG: hypothetical protein JO316_25325 [Abitibacteriaceae bacterium]|nr:hypothetical protein [Abditibacteriaceae bacterium]MBV9868692.1 hypothetical protein [Abditibacteriaceae bacterium]
MKQWRNSLFTVLALLGLMASAVPSLAWACPMTGLVGSADSVCRKVGAHAGCCCHCAMPGSKCCQQLPVPPSDTNNNSRHDTALSHSAVAPGAILHYLSQTAQTTSVVGTLPPPALSLAPQLNFLGERWVRPPLLKPQHAPPAAQGRAPPVS